MRTRDEAHRAALWTTIRNSVHQLVDAARDVDSFARLFPSLRDDPEHWDTNKLSIAIDATDENSSRHHAAEFVYAVDRNDWAFFNLGKAMAAWDEGDRAAFALWAVQPWNPWRPATADAPAEGDTTDIPQPTNGANGAHL